MSDPRQRQRQWWRGLVAFIVLCTSTGLVTACGSDNRSEAERLIDTFTDNLDRGRVEAAASATSYPNAAAATIRQMIMNLKPGIRDYSMSQFVPIDNDYALFSLDASWHFGDGRTWNYSIQGSARRLSVGWRILWDANLLMPQLGRGREVRLVRTDAAPPRINDVTGRVLMTEQTINVVSIDPGRTRNSGATTAAVAKAIEPVAPLITADSLNRDLFAAKGKPITAVSLRDGDFAILEPRLAPIPGVILSKKPRLITTDRRIYTPLLDALRTVWQTARDRTAGWAVQMFNPDGSFAIQTAGHQGPPPPDIAAALDPRLQLAAEDAVVSVGTPASIVVLQSGTGAMLAVAQNDQADSIGALRYTDRHPVGSCFDLFAAAAAIASNKAPQNVSAEEAASLAGQLGAATEYSPRAGGAPSQGDHNARPARDRPTATGDILVSPFAMAVVAAAIARGQAPTPMLAGGEPATSTAMPGPLQPEVAGRLRGFLAGSMARPEMAPLRNHPGVTAFTGYSGDSQWLIATRGDIAFAIHIENSDGGSAAAAAMAARMLTAWARPQN